MYLRHFLKNNLQRRSEILCVQKKIESPYNLIYRKVTLRNSHNLSYFQQLVFGGEKVKVKYANFDEELMQPPGPTTSSMTTQDNAYQQY